LVSVSGLTPAAYGADGRPDPAMPTAARLARAGAAAERVRSVAPATTYPLHASLVTGALPARHGVPADRQLGEHGVRATLYSHASALTAPTLWGVAGEAGRRVAALAWPTTVGASIPLLLPDVEPAGRGETWLALVADAATPWVNDLATRHARESQVDWGLEAPGPARDRVLTAVACDLLAAPQPPALLLLRLSGADAALLQLGPATPEFREALAREDAEVAALLSCVRRAGLAEQTAIVLAGDHGGLSVHTAIRANQPLEAAGLLTATATGIARWSAIARSNGGSAFVYARETDDALDARRALEAAAASSRAFRVVPAEEMLRLGADPEAWFGLEARPGFVFEDVPGGPLLVPATVRGAAGYLPDEPAMQAGLVLAGRGIRAGVRVPEMDQTDLAATVATLLGLALEPPDGRALLGLLDLAPAAGAAP
jgi:hypothetical protein